MIFRHLVFMMFLGLVLTGPAMGKGLRLITEDNPPFNFVDAKTGALSGVAHELVVALMKQADISYEAALMPWHRGYRLALDEPNSCIYGINRTQDRDELFEWIGPLFESGWAFYGYEDDLSLTSLADIENQIVAVKAGDAVATAFSAARPDARVLQVETDRMGVRLLHHGRANLWLTGIVHAKKSAELEGVAEPRMVYMWRKSVVYMGCSLKTDAIFLDRLRAAMPTLDTVREKTIHKYW